MSDYIRVMAPSHPKANRDGYIYEHVAIVEKVLGRLLPEGAQIHHVDGDRSNNTNSNLVVCPSLSYHKLLHARQRIKDAGGDPNTQRICSTCQQLKAIADFNSRRDSCGLGTQTACRACQSAYQKSYKRPA